jgi:two-component system, chemotaxis family, chemotaxis protein CheY
VHDEPGLATVGVFAAEYLVRPVVLAVQELLASRAMNSGGRIPSVWVPKRVLVVEDDTSIRMTVAEVLADEGYAVVTAENGLEALKIVANQPPHLVVLDLMMPVLDGWGFLEACRQEKLWAEIPVLVLSAYRNLAQAAHREPRINHFLHKPFELDELVAAVGRLVA